MNFKENIENNTNQVINIDNVIQNNIIPNVVNMPDYIDTSMANALAEDILEGEVAVVNGQRIIGNRPDLNNVLVNQSNLINDIDNLLDDISNEIPIPEIPMGLKLGGSKYIPNMVYDMSNINDMSNFFRDVDFSYQDVYHRCIDINYFKMSNITNMCYMFANSNIWFDGMNFNTVNVVNIAGMFKNHKSLNINDVLLNCDFSNVTDANELFAYSNVCDYNYNQNEFDAINSVNINVSNMLPNVEHIDGMFAGMHGVKNIYITDIYNIASVNNMLNFKAESLDSLIIKNINNVGYADNFIGGAKVTNLYIDNVYIVNTSNCISPMYTPSGINIHISNTNLNYGLVQNIFCINTVEYVIDNVDGKNVYIEPNNYKGSNRLSNFRLNIYNVRYNYQQFSRLFDDCRNLKHVYINGMDNSVKMTGYMFANCTNLIDIEIPNLWSGGINGYAGTSYMFKDCHNLQNIDLSDWNTYNLRSTLGMFVNCYNLTNIKYPEGRNIVYKYIDTTYTFYRCDNLVHIDLDWLFEALPVIDNSGKIVSTVHGCYNLKSINISNLNFSSTNNGRLQNVVNECPNITTVNALNWKVPDRFTSYTNLISRFFRSSYRNIENLQVSNWNININNCYNMFYNSKMLKNLNMSGWVTNNLVNTSRMFYWCNNLISVNMANWNTSSVVNMSDMFRLCNNLSDIDLTNWDVHSVINMSGMFNTCNVINLDVSNWDISNVTSLTCTFSWCGSLKNLDVSKWNSSNVTSLWGTFNWCPNITNLDLGNWDVSNVTTIMYIFTSDFNLRDINVSLWDTSKINQAAYAFQSCHNLVDINISNWNVNNITNTYSMFDGCNSLVNIDVSNWKLSNVTNITRMFAYCNNLSDASIDGIINMILNINVSNLNYTNLSNMNSNSIFNYTNINNTRYQNRWTELTNAGWTY